MSPRAAPFVSIQAPPSHSWQLLKLHPNYTQTHHSTLHNTTSNHTQTHHKTLHYTTSNYTPPHQTALSYAKLYFPAPNCTLPNCTSLPSMVFLYTTLQCTEWHNFRIFLGPTTVTQFVAKLMEDIWVELAWVQTTTWYC